MLSKILFDLKLANFQQEILARKISESEHIAIYQKESNRRILLTFCICPSPRFRGFQE